MRERPFQPAVYILASRRNGTLYCGSTGDLIRRIWEHREGVGSPFTAKYGVRLLVWYEFHGEMGGAIQREHRIKAWRRAWKLHLIEAENPGWRDLYEDLL
jgi:putative endonuclease